MIHSRKRHGKINHGSVGINIFYRDVVWDGNFFISQLIICIENDTRAKENMNGKM
jgi:hypothetical protein